MSVITLPCPFPGRRWWNPGVLDLGDKTIMIYRLDDQDIGVATINSDYGISDAQSISHVFYPFVPEDVRLFRCGPHIGMLATIYSIYASRCRVYFIELDREYRLLRMEKLEHPDSIDIFQKNWVPFIRDNSLYCISDHDPFTVLRYNHDHTEVYYKGPPVRWEHGVIRGGAPPYYYDGLWHSFFHSSVLVNDVHVYYAGHYWFDDSFKTTLFFYPLLSGNPDRFTSFFRRKVSTIFPSGVLHDGKKWIIFYGYLDTDIKILEI
jgi:hypothetical protein